MATRPDPAADGWSALSRRAWDEAWRSFSAAVAEQEVAEALEGLSWAAWWRADGDAAIDARERAYRLYRSAGRDRDAARMATWIATDSVDFRGEVAVAQGWLRRARALLADGQPSSELGWLHVHEAEKLLLPGGRSGAGGGARRRGRTAGPALAEVDLEMTGSATEGLALVHRGHIHEGIARLDEAAVAALADEFTQPWAAGWCCCNVIYGCEQVRDYDRAAQWCRKVEAWAERSQVQFLNQSCRAHYAGVLIWRGTWEQAESQLIESAARLTALRPPLAVEATVRLGELRRRQGRHAEAAAIFDQVADHPLAVLGRGELHLDQDDPAGARHCAEEYLRQAPSETPTPRAAGLELLARAAAALVDTDAATAALAELEGIADRMGTDPARASVAYVRGVVAAASGDEDRARIALEDAIRLYGRASAPYEQAQARLALALQLRPLGRVGDARRHARAAAQDLRRIGADRAARQAEELVRTLDRSVPASPLTGREREVLRLVADGLTNRRIAVTLVVSQHTVNRHVTNILTKLGTRSRSAAVAEAVRRRLI